MLGLGLGLRLGLGLSIRSETFIFGDELFISALIRATKALPFLSRSVGLEGEGRVGVRSLGILLGMGDDVFEG